jgi:hypothetical protein
MQPWAFAGMHPVARPCFVFGTVMTGTQGHVKAHTVAMVARLPFLCAWQYVVFPVPSLTHESWASSGSVAGRCICETAPGRRLRPTSLR